MTPPLSAPELLRCSKTRPSQLRPWLPSSPSTSLFERPPLLPPTELLDAWEARRWRWKGEASWFERRLPAAVAAAAATGVRLLLVPVLLGAAAAVAAVHTLMHLTTAMCAGG